MKQKVVFFNPYNENVVLSGIYEQGLAYFDAKVMRTNLVKLRQNELSTLAEQIVDEKKRLANVPANGSQALAISRRLDNLKVRAEAVAKQYEQALKLKGLARYEYTKEDKALKRRLNPYKYVNGVKVQKEVTATDIRDALRAWFKASYPKVVFENTTLENELILNMSHKVAENNLKAMYATGENRLLTTDSAEKQFAYLMYKLAQTALEIGVRAPQMPESLTDLWDAEIEAAQARAEARKEQSKNARKKEAMKVAEVVAELLAA